MNLYIDGAKMVSNLVDETKDAALKDKYVDTLMMVYDQRIKYFNKEGFVLGRKGIDLYTYRTDKIEEIYPVLKKSVELSVNKSEGAVLVYYFRAIIGMVDLQKLEKVAIIDGYDVISEIVDHNIQANQQKAKALANWENIKANIESTFEPFATCPDLISIYQKKYNSNSDDVETLKKITNVLDRKGCNDSELFFQATEKLHTLEPSAQSAYLMGSLYLGKENMSRAATYLQQAANLFEEPENQVRALNLLANIQFNQRSYSQARATAQKILQINPNYGKAYLLIGDLYAASAANCTEDDMSGKTVFWAAVDKYVKARSVDSSVESEANQRIGQYSQHFPPKEDLFFRDMEEGGSYTVGCWINEATTIRPAK
jgi:tetratricopeptide (TPR) repeat protein